MRSGGIGLGQLLLALDATMVTLIEAPRGLDLPVASAALIDSDDVRLGLALGAEDADIFFLLGIAEADVLRWIDRRSGGRKKPAAIFLKEPSEAVVTRAVTLGAAVVAVDPRARWERLYRLVNHVFEHHGDRADPAYDSGTDLFGLAQSIADRTHGMVSIEDESSHVLAYSASNDEADELRRLSILGRAGPPEHLRWLARWGVFDALRSGPQVVRVDAHPELGLRPRLAIGIHRSDERRRGPACIGTIWVQQGFRPLAEDADNVLRGAAVLAARIMSQLAAKPSTRTVRVHQLLGLRERDHDEDPADIARELGFVADTQADVIGFEAAAPRDRLADVLALSASAFHRDAQVAANGSRTYVVFPATHKPAAVTSWVRGIVGTLHAEWGQDLRAVIAASVAGPDRVAATRIEIDRVFDSAGRHPGALRQVTSLSEARTTVLLDEIVTLVGEGGLSDPRVGRLDTTSRDTLRAYLDGFGDVGLAARWLHVHPNTVRYRVRGIEKRLGASLGDPDTRLLLSLSLRASS
jgi:DNA-binding PucR family transcriptional regulator